MGLEFTTKARTLALLQTKLKTAKIAPLQIFTVEDWMCNKSSCIEVIKKSFSNQSLIVRSSTNREDGQETSNAGAFLSIQNVTATKLETAINQVISSFGGSDPGDEILIQPMLTDVVRSGVAFSHDPNTCAPYRVINWSQGTDTTTVTGGLGGKVWLQAAYSIDSPKSHFTSILILINELLQLFSMRPIDCEFAITESINNDGIKYEEIWLLQVRPLILFKDPEPELDQTNRLKVIEEKIRRNMQPQPFLLGKKTIYGVMPDWNPAEIIGIRPKPLSLSLYRELVTDAIWAYQRHNYGYRNLRSFPLMQHFFGLPYIDVRCSFNSFIPSDLDDDLAARLVDYYIDRLAANTTLHDKIEFDVVLSCYSLDLTKKLTPLEEAGFSKNECELLSQSLRKLTNRIINPSTGLWKKDAEKLDILNSRRNILMSSGSDLLAQIYWLLEDAKRYGTLPFAGLARAGFIAIQILKSLVSIGIFSDTDYHAFLMSVSTINRQMMHHRTKLSKIKFLELYGHLRPGSYDILSYRYDETPDRYFDWEKMPRKLKPTEQFSLSSSQERQIGEALKAHGLLITPTQLVTFIKTAIELRETAKYHFTHNLSDALLLITKLGLSHGYDREDLAYSNINIFKELHIVGAAPEGMIARSIAEGKKRYEETSKVSLPPLITDSTDIWGFEWPETVPNFITQKQVTGQIRTIDTPGMLAGSIVCIPNADPGFDWLFSHEIGGLITAWGGPNSHMAIRAGELGLPAVIGTGEALYRQCSDAERIFIDCAGRRIEVLQ
jgi:glutamine kinase